VNKKGEFNVPFGTAHRSEIFSRANILKCSEILNKSDVNINQLDFQDATKFAADGDFVFFDPPYVTKHNFNGFRDYNEKLFSWDDQIRLAEEAKRLVSIGVTVIISNADHEDVRALYEGFSMHEISRFSTLASNPGKRAKVTEAVFKGTPQ
jgi:DNA adenine methylase